MAYRVPLPAGGRATSIDLIDPNSTAGQRLVRRVGLSGFEPSTQSTLLTLFDAFDPGFAFWDVGANFGLYSVIADRMFAPGAVHAFEPTPATAAVARRIVRANDADVQVLELAVSDAPGRAELHLADQSDVSNSLVPGFKASAHRVQVAVTTLDEHAAVNGSSPDVMKIDVEGHESAVLHGASEMIAQARPYIVLEVLNRRSHDFGPDIEGAMGDAGYSYYRLDAAPTWEREAHIAGRAGAVDNDWLLSPQPLPADFGARFDRWRARVADCIAARNPRVPVTATTLAAWRRGGVSEVLASARRWRSSAQSAGSPRPTPPTAAPPREEE